jgi:carbon storage regulator
MPGKEVSSMLTIPRKAGESVVIDDDITLTVLEIWDNKVRFLVQYPTETTVHRAEAYDAIRRSERLPSDGAG